METSNTFRRHLTENKSAVGIWQMFPSPSVSRTLAQTPGLTWVLIDCEHGNISDDNMHEAIASVSKFGVSPIVRIPDAQGWMIKRALDAGAHGIMVPLVSKKETAEYISKHSHFPPMGSRGFGSPFSHGNFGLPNASEYLRDANKNIVVIVQIETAEAVANVEDIASVEGIDMLFVGPVDLSISLGHPLAFEPEHKVLSEAIEKTLKAAHAAGKKAGIFTGNSGDAQKRIEQGFDMVNLGTDVSTLSNGLSQGIKELTGKSSANNSGGY